MCCCQIADTSDFGDKESSVPEAHAEMPNRTAAPSQASTMMPSSYDKNTALGGEGKCDIQANLSLHAPLLNLENYTHNRTLRQQNSKSNPPT